MEGKEMASHICESAIELFASKGYDEVSVNEICRAVNITKPTFYKYVKTKEDILFHYYDSVKGLDDSFWDKSGTFGCWQTISDGFRVCLDHYVSLGTDLLAKVMIYQVSSGTLSFQNDLNWNRKMMQLIAKAQSSGEIRNMVQPSVLLELMKAYTLGFCFSLCTMPAQDIEKAVDQCVENLKIICQVPQTAGEGFQ